MTQPSLISGQQLKRQGMAKAAGKHSAELALAKEFAHRYARSKPDLTIEDVRYVYENVVGPWNLGNAAGLVFSGPEWVCVGYKQATRPEAHARILRVWRLKR